MSTVQEADDVVKNYHLRVSIFINDNLMWLVLLIYKEPVLLSYL
jgi:hypothetical protein